MSVGHEDVYLFYDWWSGDCVAAEHSTGSYWVCRAPRGKNDLSFLLVIIGGAPLLKPGQRPLGWVFGAHSPA